MTYLSSFQSLIASQRRRLVFLFFLTAFGCLSVASLRASEPKIADSSLTRSTDQEASSADTSLQLPLIADSWFGPIKSALSSRTRMLQFGAIACCIALYIIWWRK
jgi:hypothetical protein